MAPTAEPERVRWVRFAADCAEHILCLADSSRPQTEAAVQAAREWADDPIEERREAEGRAAEAAEGAAFETLHQPVGVVTEAAADAAYAAYFADAATYAADTAYYAAYASDASTLRVHRSVLRIGGRSALPDAGERDWQAGRLRYYGLRYPPEATP